MLTKKEAHNLARRIVSRAKKEIDELNLDMETGCYDWGDCYHVHFFDRCRPGAFDALQRTKDYIKDNYMFLGRLDDHSNPVFAIKFRKDEYAVQGREVLDEIRDLLDNTETLLTDDFTAACVASLKTARKCFEKVEKEMK